MYLSGEVSKPTSLSTYSREYKIRLRNSQIEEYISSNRKKRLADMDRTKSSIETPERFSGSKGSLVKEYLTELRDAITHWNEGLIHITLRRLNTEVFHNHPQIDHEILNNPDNRDLWYTLLTPGKMERTDTLYALTS